MASIKFDEDGSGANHRCLPRDPEFDAVVPGIQDSRGKIWGAQFEKLPSDPQSNLDDRTVTCAVCRVTGARNFVRIQGTKTCPDGWRTEYMGYLGSGNNARRSEATTEYVCIDENPEVNMETGGRRDDGTRLGRVEAICRDRAGSLPCDKYPNGNELTCVVCSK